MTTPGPAPTLVYVADPMCSWCWGFAPVVDRLCEELDLPLRVVVGGLRPGPSAEPVDDRMAEFLEGCWTQVHAASGQPFDHALLGQRGWSYDTEPACTAVVAVRERQPEKAKAAFDRLQHAFYAEGAAVWDWQALPELLADLVDPELLRADLADRELRKRTWADFAWAQSLGIRGFPTVLVEEGQQLALLTQGYAPAEALLEPLRAWLAERRGGTAETSVQDGESCSVDAPC